jgi:hypothetical protein
MESSSQRTSSTTSRRVRKSGPAPAPWRTDQWLPPLLQTPGDDPPPSIFSPPRPRQLLWASRPRPGMRPKPTTWTSRRASATRWIASAIVTVGVVVIVVAFVSSRNSDESRPTTTVQAGTAEAPTSARVVPSSNDIPYAALPPVASTPAVPALEPSHDVVMPSFQRGATSHGTNAGATPAVKISPPATTRVREASSTPSPASVTGAEAPAPGPATRPRPSTTIVHDLPF